jgi:hypothetical protein
MDYSIALGLDPIRFAYLGHVENALHRRASRRGRASSALLRATGLKLSAKAA